MTKLEKRIITFPPVAYLIRTSKRITLPGMEGLPLYDVMSFFFQQVQKIGFSERAASISFNIIMAIPGILMFLFTLVPFLPKSIHFHDQLLRTLDDVLKNRDLYKLLKNIIQDFFVTQRKGLMWFSVMFIIFFSSNAMMGIMRTFDRSYFEERSTRFMAKRWTAFKLTSLLILLILTSILLLATQGGIKTFIFKKLGWDVPIVLNMIDYSRWLVIIGLTYFTVAFIYRYGPAVRVRWKLSSPGTILASALMLLFTWLFSMYVNNFSNYNKVYGSIAAVILLMNIIYINSLILLIGFEINVSITAIKSRSQHRIELEEADNLEGKTMS